MDEKICDERVKHISEKIQDHESRIDKLENTYAIMQKMDLRMENVEKAVDKIDKKLNEKTEEKGKKWDKLLDYLFYFFLAAVLSYIALK